MDGLHDLSAQHGALSHQDAAMRRTLKSAICCVGVGLHSGRRVNVTLRPAPTGTGVVFRRTDLGLDIPARFDTVCDTRLCTVVGAGSARVGTVEHLMAALAASEVTDIVAELDGPEVPVLDGSSAPWIFLIDCAGTVALDTPARVIEVLRTVRVQDGEAFAELRPGRGAVLDMSLSIEFAAAAIGRQALTLAVHGAVIRHALAPARTFTQAHEVEGLRAAGLAQGGSLDNAVVVDGARVLNPGGLRMPDEFVRHKMLDAVGDLSLAGAALQGRFVGNCSGHTLNNRVLHALFADSANWRDVTPGLWTNAVQQAA
ncbi:MAG: UDP-3-O-acyl-N-acetylglucosamine deacetylase [Gemmatimonadaceae bacterium]|nr:UDP-3-O-acyl-N-acetylglucosamine deacetylase [Acetobacteraceae bacterium]